MTARPPASAAGLRHGVMLVSGYLGDGGGAERQIVELATRLDRGRYEPMVVSLVAEAARARHGGHHYRRLVEAGIEVVTLEKRTRVGLGQILALARLLRRRRPAIVHSFLFSMNWRTRVASLLAPGTRVLVSERSVNSWKGRWQHSFERILLLRTDRIIANAEAIRGFLVAEGRIPPDRILVIPNGVDTSRFRPAGDGRAALRSAFGWRPDEIAVGHSGTMAPHKGQSQVLRACAAVLPDVPALRVVLFGDGPERARLAALAHELGLDGRVEMPGFVPDVERRLSALDIYVHFSREREGCSNAILEAMACGLPVVATAVGGNAELVTADTGVLVPEEDVPATAAAIARLAGDAALRGRLGRAALDAVRSKFAVARMVEATRDEYDRLLA